MSDPQPVPGRKRPRRAKPLQPDLPGSGSGVEDRETPADPPTAEKQKEQSDTALSNVREGYS